MKKIILSIAVLLLSVSVFAETRVIDDSDISIGGGLYVDLGTPIYSTKRLEASHGNIKSDTNEFLTKGFSGEIGYMESDEDGIGDIVRKSGIGFSVGTAGNGKDFAWAKNNKQFCSNEDTNFANVYIKDVGGIQINLLCFSVGGLIGPKFGFDWMNMKAATAPAFTDDSLFKENRLFLDFACQPYISVNIVHHIKISFSAEFDLPIFRCRFTKEPDVEEYIFNWDWFKNDVPITYFAGIALLF